MLRCRIRNWLSSSWRKAQTGAAISRPTSPDRFTNRFAIAQAPRVNAKEAAALNDEDKEEAEGDGDADANAATSGGATSNGVKSTIMTVPAVPTDTLAQPATTG